MESSWIFTWVVIPLLILIARVLDVSLGTMRIIFLAQRRKVIVPILGFFEVFIWIIAIGQVIHHVNNVYYYLAYACGFALGNFVGICIEEKLAMGNLMVRIVTRSSETSLIDRLRSHDYRVTAVDGEGVRGPVKVIFTIIKRKDKNDVLDLIKTANPNSFYTVEEVQKAREERVPAAASRLRSGYRRLLFLRRRKGK